LFFLLPTHQFRPYLTFYIKPRFLTHSGVHSVCIAHAYVHAVKGFWTITIDPLKIIWQHLIHTCTITRRVEYWFMQPHYKLIWRHFIHICTVTRRSDASRFLHPRSNVKVTVQGQRSNKLGHGGFRTITFDPLMIIWRHYTHTCNITSPIARHWFGDTSFGSRME
jgi:hypothetical protein